MRKFLFAAIPVFLLLSGCDDPPPIEPKVILIRNGLMETSRVGRFDEYCWAVWYKGIEHILLKKDGTADDPPFHYRWEPLDHDARVKGAAAMFDALGCKEPSRSNDR